MHIPKAKELEQKVFAITNEKEFDSIALEVFHFQYKHNSLFRQYCELVQKTPQTVHYPAEIPFLPISFYKSHAIKTTSFDADLVFQSSGTTGSLTSSHHVKDRRLYDDSYSQGFNFFYGSVQEYCIIGLLPSYLERGNSSLVYMVDGLIRQSGHPKSGFYLSGLEQLAASLQQLEAEGQKALVIGVTYALLDFALRYPQQLTNTIIMETGGMKGRGKEMTKEELYGILKDGFGVSSIHAEFGMTEMLSQAYGIDGRMATPPWMKVLFRDETDPFAVRELVKPGSGAINIIDLANLYSCSFMATDDAGRTSGDGFFEVLGRLDHSDTRGCSLLAV